MGFFDKIKQGLTKTRDALSESWNDLFSEDTELDEDFYDELEESLILADMGHIGDLGARSRRCGRGKGPA